MTLAAVVLFAATAVATSVHLPVSTNNPQAQAAIDRGLFLYYAYDGDDAARMFELAAALDPRLAMAFWGVALASGPDLNTPMTAGRFERAARAVRQAAAVATLPPARDQELVVLMGRRYRGSFADWRSDDAAYRDGMLRFARASGDENVALLAAEALLEGGGLAWSGGAPAAVESREALELVTRILRDDPKSAMANHLCIHLYDLAPDRRPARQCAQRLDAAAFPPEAEHLAHMPAHYWIETGDYAAAVASSDRAFELLERLPGGLDGEHVRRYAKHDVGVGYSAAMMLGNYAVARVWALRMEGVFDQDFDAITALRFGRYADAYAADPGAFAGESVRGWAALRLGHAAEARALAKRVAGEDLTHGYMAQLFLAEAATADGTPGDATRWIERARDDQRANFTEELIPLFPADEVLGGIYLRYGGYAHAVAAFSEALARYPNDPRALYGLAAALSAQGQAAQAVAVRSRFQVEWKDADTGIADALP
ncbi:MAG: tetratricopeptide repeat protein [Candidatus Eremiobacteraeota bacterium]|nr:tetratricopeptide repeat protein [Candidatus Eremiobacteraeota bacterium]